MSQVKGHQKWWLIVFGFLITAIIAGGVVFFFQYSSGGQPVEITLASTPASVMTIHISGAVANTGIYTFSEDSPLGDILQSAGGTIEDADLANMTIYIPYISESSYKQPQKVNINTAEVWLLEALPGIGPTLAGRIIEYREAEGYFSSIEEIMQVPGIGSTTLDKIKDKIEV
jgi:competence protein ComEA